MNFTTEHLQPVLFRIQKVLPFVYDDSMSLYEFVAKLQQGLNEVIESQNTILDDVQAGADIITGELQDLYCYLKSQALLDDINKILNGWLEDGTLANLIANYEAGKALSVDTFYTPYKMADTADLQRFITDMTAAQFYSLFDSLTQIESRFWSRNVWGNDSNENPLIYYTWRARKYDDVGDNSLDQSIIENLEDRLQTVPRMIITAGVHGNEKGGIYSLYLTLKDMLAGSEEGKYILDNYNLVILPCVCPWGINNSSRLNVNGVNINRNFERGWNAYPSQPGTSNYKGPSALSEVESQFVDDILQTYYTIPGIHGCTLIDFHTQHYELHDDKRVLWFTANYWDMRPRMLKFAEWLKQKILTVYPVLMPNYENEEIFTRFVYVTDPTLVNQAKKYGYWGTVGEIPDNLYQLDSEQNGLASKTLGYLICYNYIYQMSSFSDRGPKDVYTSLLDIGASNSNTLQEVINLLPNGSTIYVRLSSATTLMQDMPMFNNAAVSGMLTITKSPTPSSVQCILQYQSVIATTSKIWIGSADNSGFNGWIQQQSTFIDNNRVVPGMTLANIKDYMNVNEELLMRITNTHSLYSQMPVAENGVLRCTEVNNQGNDAIVLCEFTTTGTTPAKYFTVVYNTIVRTWKQYTAI